MTPPLPALEHATEFSFAKMREESKPRGAPCAGLPWPTPDGSLADSSGTSPRHAILEIVARSDSPGIRTDLRPNPSGNSDRGPCRSMVFTDQLNSQIPHHSSSESKVWLLRHHERFPTRGVYSMEGLPVEALERVAAYFQALSEPTRLQILNLLRQREHNVGELAQLCGYTSANISRHLAMLTAHGLVAREARGTSVYYRIADESIYALCDLVCGTIARQLEGKVNERELFLQTTVRAEPIRRGSGGRKARRRA